VLSDTTAANLTRAVGRLPEITESDAVTYVRSEKRPNAEPVSLNIEDVTSAYSYLSGGQPRAQTTESRAIPSDEQSQRYAAASAAYTRPLVAESHAFAGRGEVLELQA
jgi:hypothetical protein